MNTYHGIRTDQGCAVTVNRIELNPRLDLRNHSPSGFEWGYEGSGPAQLALAILAYEFDDSMAQAYYQIFKREVICNLARDRWTLTSTEITTALEKIKVADDDL